MVELQRFKLFIDGRWSEAASGESFESVNPATAEPWALVPAAGAKDVDRAVAAAHRAFLDPAWAAMTPTARGRLLMRLADLLVEHAEELGALETVDSGKLLKETRSQAAYVAEYYRYYGGLADKIHGRTLPIDKPDMHVYTEPVPIGVVAAVVPWNAQMFLTATKLGPALAAGNTVVIKASEIAPTPLLRFGRLIEAAGFPAGVVNILTGFGGSCGKALTSHPDVARVAFTGGPETARHIVRNSAENLAVTSLELGGKSPILVFEDAELEGAVNGVVAGNFGATGQSCVAGSRVLVQESVFEPFVERLTRRTGAIVIGDPLADATQVGPLATEAQRDRIERLVAETVAAGGKLIAGGRRPEAPAAGWYYAPTILDCPSPDLPSVRHELFGPVVSLLKFANEDEAIAVANDTRYGLAAGVFTRDLARAVRASKRIRSGIVWVNTYRAVSPIAPFGGFKDSGYGREGGVDAILDYTRAKTVWINTSSQPMADPFVMR